MLGRRETYYPGGDLVLGTPAAPPNEHVAKSRLREILRKYIRRVATASAFRCPIPSTLPKPHCKAPAALVEPLPSSTTDESLVVRLSGVTIAVVPVGPDRWTTMSSPVSGHIRELHRC